MPRRHVAPKHRSSRSFKQQLGDVTGQITASAATRTAVAVGAIGLAVGVGALTFDAPQDSQAAVPSTAADSVQPSRSVMNEAGALLKARQGSDVDQVSRSVVRPALLSEQRADKTAGLPPKRQDLGGAMTKALAPPPPPSPRSLAVSLLGSYGWDSGQFSCLDALWNRESGWNPYAQNSSSGAYGIPQALPGSKMSTAGSDWATNAATQIRWGLSYIRASYGSPCGAWYHSESYGWY